jgi:hypothetical protein
MEAVSSLLFGRARSALAAESDRVSATVQFSLDDFVAVETDDLLEECAVFVSVCMAFVDEIENITNSNYIVDTAELKRLKKLVDKYRTAAGNASARLTEVGEQKTFLLAEDAMCQLFEKPTGSGHSLTDLLTFSVEEELSEMASLAAQCSGINCVYETLDKMSALDFDEAGTCLILGGA